MLACAFVATWPAPARTPRSVVGLIVVVYKTYKSMRSWFDAAIQIVEAAESVDDAPPSPSPASPPPASPSPSPGGEVVVDAAAAVPESPMAAASRMLKFWTLFAVAHACAVEELPYSRELRGLLVLLAALPTAYGSPLVEAAFTKIASPLLGYYLPRSLRWLRNSLRRTGGLFSPVVRTTVNSLVVRQLVESLREEDARTVHTVLGHGLSQVNTERRRRRRQQLEAGWAQVRGRAARRASLPPPRAHPCVSPTAAFADCAITAPQQCRCEPAPGAGRVRHASRCRGSRPSA